MTPRVAAVVEQCWHQVPGGTATSTVRTLDAIQAAGKWSVTGVAAFHRDAPSPMAVPTVPIAHSRLGRRVLYETWHRFRQPGLPRSARGVDVVHATGGVIPPTGGVPLVVTVHDLAFFHRPEHFTPHGVRFMTRSFELAKSEAAAVIVPSEVTAQDCIAHGIESERVHVVPWGVAVDDLASVQHDRVRAAYDLPDEFVLWVGTAEPRKNLDGLIEAMTLAQPDVPLVLAGAAGWGVDLDALMSSAPMVRHLGPIPESDLAALYGLASLFVYPSLLEGFGMPVLEAMAQGTAVVTSADTATAEVAGEAALLVDPSDPRSIGEAISSLLADTARRSELETAGRTRAAAMSWPATATATTAVYDSVRS